MFTFFSLLPCQPRMGDWSWILLLGFAALLCIPLLAAQEAYAAVPAQRLFISFDLKENLLRATAEIDIRADEEAKIEVGDLDIKGVLINNTETRMEVEEGSTTLSPAAADRVLTIHYVKRFPGPPASPGGLISEQGITLTGFWHPMVRGDCLYTLTAVIPTHFEAVSEAEEITSSMTAAGKEVYFSYPRPLAAINFVAGPYMVNKIGFGQGQELYTYFFREDEALVPVYQAKVLDYLSRYAKLLGSYPYQRFSVVENRLPTGFAMPTFTLLGQAVVRLPFIKDTSLGHEVLHAWFGNAVGVDYATGNWSEGLVTYLADHLFAEDKHTEIDFRKGQIINYVSHVAKENTFTLKDFKGASDTDPQGRALRAIGYGRASFVFHMLRTRLGDEVFFGALRDFYDRMKYKKAGWADLKASFEDKGLIELDDFFTQWLTRSDIPNLSISEVKSREKEGRPMVAFSLVQLTATPYCLDIPVTIQTSAGDVRRIITCTGKQDRFEIPVDGAPLELILDEHYDLLRVLNRYELPPVWSRFQGAAVKLAVVQGDRDKEFFAPLLDQLVREGCQVKDSGEITMKDLTGASVIFFDLDSPLARGLFARPLVTDAGFILEVRNNPIDPEQVFVLIKAGSTEEVARATGKLSHYGKYSYLSFDRGDIREKRIMETDQGLGLVLEVLPKGIPVPKAFDFEKIIDELQGKRVIYVGETHTSYEDHRLQLQVIRALFSRDPNLAIGMEMFERPYQAVLDDYLAQRIDEPTFLKQSHYFNRWGYDYRLYRDIIDFARRNNVPIVALNAEKPLVEKVFKGEDGVFGLSEEEKTTIPVDRDLTMPGYRERLEPVFVSHGNQNNGGSFNGFLQSQAIWDETMADSIARYLMDHPKSRMVVVAGGGHVAYGTGIPKRVFRMNQEPFAIVLPYHGGDIEPGLADYLMFVSPYPLPDLPVLGVALEEKESGLAIANLVPHGQAQKADLKKGDVILALDDKEVSSLEDIKIVLLYKEKGQTVRVRIRRSQEMFGDETLEIEVPL